MSFQWQEINASEFDQYPTNIKTREPDDLDAVMSAVESGRVVRISVDDESAIRGRRMALGRRAKTRGFPIEMRYQGNTIVVRKAQEGGAQSVPADVPYPGLGEDLREMAKKSRRGSRAAQEATS